MGQHVSSINSKILDSVGTCDAKLDSGTIVTCNGNEDINLFLSVKASKSSSAGSALSSEGDRQVAGSDRSLTRQIQNNLSLLTNTIELTKLNTQLHELFANDIFLRVVAYRTNAMHELKATLTNEQQLTESLRKKLADDQTTDRSIFFKRSTLPSEVVNAKESDSKENQLEELSYFFIESLTSILLSLIKSAETNNSTVIHQILTLTSQLCEQIPGRCLSTSNNLLSASLKPLTDYIHDLTLSADPIVAKQALKVHLSLAIAQVSLKDLLPLLTYLMFITDECFDVRNLLLQLNNDLTVVLDNYEKQKQPSIHRTETDEDDDEEEQSTTSHQAAG